MNRHAELTERELPVSGGWPGHATFVEAVRYHAATDSPSRIGMAGPDSPQLDYPAFWARAARCAEELHGRGFRPGDRVAIDTATSLELMIAILGVLAGGGVLVPLPRVRANGSGHDQRLAAAALSLSDARWCLASKGAAGAYESAVRTANSATTVVSLPDVTVDLPPDSVPPPGGPDPDRPAVIQFSSGSTSAPKGIVLTHGGLAANLAALTERIDLGPSARGISWLPFTHDMGLIGSFAGSLYAGASLRIMTPGTFVREPERWISALSEFRATHTAGPAFGYAMVADRLRLGLSALASCDLSTMRAAAIGAESVSPSLCEKFERLLAPLGLRPHTLLPVYGLAENGVVVAARAPHTPTTVRQFDRQSLIDGRLIHAAPYSGRRDHVTLIGHGPPVTGTSVRVVSPSGRPLGEGEVGELRVGGRSATRLMLTPSGEADPATPDGFVPTGDLGAIVGGELFVVGRLKEVFKVHGRVFAPPDLEAVIMAAHPPGVLKATVVAAMREGDTTDSVLVFLETSHDASAADAAAAARLSLLREFRIRAKEVLVGEPGVLPRTTSGKPKRVELATAYLAGEFDKHHPLWRIVGGPRQQEGT